MGREAVIANIRKRMIAMIVGGVILTLMGGFISFAAVVAGEYGVLILGLFALTPGVIFLIFGISRRTHPEKSGIFKANPDLLQQADELYANIQYQDDYIIVSDRVLANKKVPFQMCWRDEAYGIYQHTASMNFISYTNEIIVCTKHKKNVLRFNVYAKGKDTAMGLMQLLSQCCPNAMVGYTPETLAYVKEMQRRAQQ